jgi:hypothetical protein
MYVDKSRSSILGFNEVGLLCPGLSTVNGGGEVGRKGRKERRLRMSEKQNRNERAQ